MDEERYHRLISDERQARNYLIELCFPDWRRFCPRCNCAKLYGLSDGRYRCSRCKYTFHEFSGRWINHGRLSAVQWLRLARSFQEGHPVLQMASLLGFPYGSAYEAVRVIRLAILARGDAAGRLVSQAFIEGRKPLCGWPNEYRDVPVFAIWWQGEQVRVEMLPQFSADNLIGLFTSMDRLGGIVFVGDIIGFEGFVFYEPAHLRRYRVIPLRVDNALANKRDGFWGWAKRELIKYHGMTYNNFPLYLKEMEFRFNNGPSADFIDNLLQCLCDVKPRHPRPEASHATSGRNQNAA